jgi:hypothetical protein
MRALTMDEVGFVSGGGTPLAQQAEQAAREALGRALSALGLDPDYILGAIGTGGSGTVSITAVGGSGGGGVLSAVSNWAKGLVGTVWGGNGLAIGASRNGDGSINIGVGVGVGLNISSSGLKDQTIQADLGISREGGQWKFGGSLLIWIGATTDAENTAFWNTAFGN